MGNPDLPEIETDRRGDILVVRLHLVRIDPGDVRRVREPLLALASGDRPRIILDLAAVDSLCNESIGVLLLLAKRARSHGGRLVLCNLQPYLLDVFSPLLWLASKPGWEGPIFAATVRDGLAAFDPPSGPAATGGDAASP